MYFKIRFLCSIAVDCYVATVTGGMVERHLPAVTWVTDHMLLTVILDHSVICTRVLIVQGMPQLG